MYRSARWCVRPREGTEARPYKFDPNLCVSVGVDAHIDPYANMRAVEDARPYGDTMTLCV